MRSVCARFLIGFLALVVGVMLALGIGDRSFVAGVGCFFGALARATLQVERFASKEE